MKTIEIKSGNQTVLFTTKSVTLDGKEYFYSDITELYHSPVVHTYQFECYGEVKKLTYEKKDAKLLNAIFSQVKNLEAKKQAAAEKAAENTAAQVHAKAATPTPVEEPAPAKEPETPAEAESAPETPVLEETPSSKETHVNAKELPADTLEDMIQATIELNEERAKKEAAKEAKKAKKKAIREAKKNGTPIPDEYLKPESEEKESIAIDPEKMERLKKSLKIFGIILGALIAVSIIYYFVFGTPNEPTDTNPSNIESQQYDDIDQLIDDMQ